VKTVTAGGALENAYEGAQGARYELRPEDLLAADKKARARRLDLIGIFHSHPDCDAYFSKTDLENSCPWYSFVVLSVKGRQVRSCQQLPAERRPDRRRERRIDMAKVLIPTPLRQFADKQIRWSCRRDGRRSAGALTTQFPDLRKQLFNDEGKLRSFVNVYLNDEDIRYLQKDATPVLPRRYGFDRAEHRRWCTGRGRAAVTADLSLSKTRSCATRGT
jgi:sulfur-carrier protein